MAKYRQNRINDEMQKELMMILRRVKDPRVLDAFVSVTSVDCSADLKYAKIYYSALHGDEKELARSLNLRITPELTFLRDSSITYGAHIASILNKLDITEEEPEDNEQP